MQGEGSVHLTVNRNDIWKIGTLTVAPFDWLEASYFYYRPRDLRWTDGDGKEGHDLDKGFNIKASYKPPVDFLPRFAVGIDDLAGTGYFAREYFVSTFDFKHLKLTIGTGWGKYDKGNGISNPLSIFSDHFKNRYEPGESYGGTLNVNQWFTGDASIFGGIEYFVPHGRGLRIKIENNPFNYLDFSAGNRPDANIKLRKSESDLNFGLSFPLKKYGFIDLSFIKGNIINLAFSFGAKFDEKLVKKSKINPKVSNNKEKLSFYEDLLSNLRNNKIYLQTASYESNSNDKDNDNLDIAIAISYANPIRSSSFASYISSKVAKNHGYNPSQISVTHTMLGMETNKISYFNKDVNDLNNLKPIELILTRTEVQPGNKNSFLENKYKPDILFPAVFQSISPNVVPHVGNPEKFLFRGFVLQHEAEIQFSRNLILTSNLKFNLSDNFRDTLTGPGSPFLPHVRTDLMEYLKQSNNYISRLQLDYFWSPKKEFYAKLSTGIFEMMYGGYGGEILYKPFKSNFMIGMEAYHVKKRAFDQGLDFLDYETSIGHINLNYFFERSGIIANLSFGKYLARDIGYTLDLSRVTESGFRSGVFFTRTNVSAAEFGEGSFDKGFYFKIPFNLFSKSYTRQSLDFKLRPLTRDGGAKLEHDKRLIDLIDNGSYIEITRGWNGFLD